MLVFLKLTNKGTNWGASHTEPTEVIFHCASGFGIAVQEKFVNKEFHFVLNRHCNIATNMFIEKSLSNKGSFVGFFVVRGGWNVDLYMFIWAA